MTSTHNVVLPLFAATPRVPHKRYRTLVADPPWRYNSKLEGLRGATDYPTMTVEELMTMPVGLWAEDNAHLYLWTTDAFMVPAHRIASAWGFEVKNVLTWVKGQSTDDPRMGVGFYFRHASEFVLFCTRGSLPVKRHDIANVFAAPRSKHSEKPAAFYDLVARMSHGPYIDVFARTQRWIGNGETAFEVMDTWGDQAFTPTGLPTPDELKAAL